MPGLEIVSRTPDVLRDAILLKEKYEDGALISGTDYLLEQALCEGYELVIDYMREKGFKKYNEFSYQFNPELWIVKPEESDEVYTRFKNIAAKNCPELKIVYREGQEEKYLVKPFEQAIMCVVSSGKSIADALGWSKPANKEELMKWLFDDWFEVKKVLETRIEVYYWGSLGEEPVINLRSLTNKIEEGDVYDS